MKAFFILLLLSNLVFGVLQWLYPYEQVFSRERPQQAAEQLVLLDETQQNNPPPASEPQDAEQTSVATTLPSPQKTLCYTLGPFKDEQLAQQVIIAFKQQNLIMSTRPSREKEYMGMMVYIDGHSSRDEAIATADALAAKGIRDYIIINEESKTNALSLGVFGLKKNAERRMSKIAALGYPVESEPRYRTRTIYWLDYAEAEPDSLLSLIDRLKVEQGISRITRACS
jgi:hypothetical protein